MIAWHLGLGRRSLPLLAAGFFILLALGAAIFWLVGETRLYAATNADALRRRVGISDTLSALQDAETGQRGYLLTADDAYLEPYRDGLVALPPLLAQMLPLLPGTERDRFAATVTERLGILQETVDLVAAGKLDAARDLVLSGRGKVLMDRLRGMLAGVDTRQAAILAQAETRLAESGRLLQYVAVAAIGGVLLVAAVGLGFARRHAADLAAANDAARAANEALEDRVAERTADLAEANEEVQRFATVVTHDLRAPLVNVMGFASELEAALPPLRELVQAAERVDPALVRPDARAALDSDIPEALGFIRSGTVRMDRLINAILKLSREGRRVLQPEPIAMQPTLEALADTLAHQTGDGEIVVEDGLPDIVSDRLAIEQIFGNLLDNAVKYLDPARPGRITVRGRDRGRFLVYEVSDNGRGIHARDLGRIFEPFRRAGIQDQPGEGIGLAHVRALARRLGGAITCDSTPGEGSTFRVTLPRRLMLPGSEKAAAGRAAFEEVA